MTNIEKITEILSFFDEEFYPSVICSSCRYHFLKFLKSSDEKSKAPLLGKVENKGHGSQKRKRHVSFGNDDYSCFFCEVVKKRFKSFGGTSQKPSKKSTQHTQHDQGRLCSGCLTPTNLLNRHKCQKPVLMKNLFKMCEERNLLDRFINQALRKKAKNCKPNRLLELTIARNKRIRILYNFRKRILSKADVNFLRNSIMRSGNKLRKNLRLVRKALGRGAVEKKVEVSLAAEEDIFEELIEYKASFFYQKID